MTGLPGQIPIPYPESDPVGYRRPGPESRYAAVADYLRQHPGEWCCIDQRPTQASAKILARNIRSGRPAALYGMDASVRRGFEVWARYPSSDED
jgi:hypothetical protein